MNAQEAIEITRKKLMKLEDYHDRMQRLKEFLINNRIFDKVEIEKTLEDLKAEIDALSIVLESAKYLHRDILEPSRQTEWRGKADKRLSILYDIPEEGIEILADDLERIGIKEQTNERG